MISKAKTENPDIDFMLCDANNITDNYDLIFSNACLQWIPNHNILIPSLMEKLNKDGVLAVQIPMNSEEPLFQLISEVANECRWGLEEVLKQLNSTLTPLEYYNILNHCSSSFDIWEVKYYHTLFDHRVLVDWVKGSRIDHTLIF